MSRSTLFSASSLATKKGALAAAYYREYAIISKLSKAYAEQAKVAPHIEAQLISEAMAAYTAYKATIAALRLANNRVDSRHALFAAMNTARGRWVQRKKSLDAFRAYRGSIFAG